MVWLMLGRVLFILVGLIIAASLVLPVYPPDPTSSGPPAAVTALAVADTMAGDRATPAGRVNCPSTCSCAQVLPTTSISPGSRLTLTMYLIVTQPLPRSSFTPPPAPSQIAGPLTSYACGHASRDGAPGSSGNAT